MPKASRPAGYRLDVAAVVSRVIGTIPNVQEKKGVSGRPQFFSSGRLFAFVASDGVALKLPAEAVDAVVDGADYLPFKMRNKPVLREWVRIRHAEASAYRQDAALFRQASRFVSEPAGRRGAAARAGAAPARRQRAK